jgi:hypothetical protein
MRFFVNGVKEGKSIPKVVDSEDKAIAYVDYMVANGAKYVSVLAITDKDNSIPFEQGNWEYTGEMGDSCFWLMVIEDTYND